jgi:hypothetical protein
MSHGSPLHMKMRSATAILAVLGHGLEARGTRFIGEIIETHPVMTTRQYITAVNACPSESTPWETCTVF